MLLCTQTCNALVTALCLALSGAYLIFYSMFEFSLEIEWFSILLLALIYGQAIYLSHKLRINSLEQNRLLIAAINERDEFE